MLGIHDYWLFLVSGIVLNLTPGQDTMYILGHSLTGGRRAGVASAFGITVGSVIHTLAAAVGLSVLLATFPLAFTGVKLCGAAYLVFLGANLRRAILERFPPGRERTAWLRWLRAREAERSCLLKSNGRPAGREH